MANELQTIVPPLLETMMPNAQGNVAVGIKHLLAGNKIEHLHIDTSLSDAPPPILEPDAQKIKFNRNYYNLIIWGSEEFINYLEPFKISADRLLKYTSDEIKKQLSDMEDKQTQDMILSFPCLFANENNRRGGGSNQTVGFGYLQRIKVRTTGVMVFPHVLCRLSQQKINEAMFELDIEMPEFTHSHWSIKKIDLIAELQDIGFPL